MSLAQKKDLVGRVDSQLLLGDRVVVDTMRDNWAHVTVPGQRSPLDARGYPGWVPLAQLTFDAPARAAREATVVAHTAWLTNNVNGERVMEVSMSTRLPVRATDPAGVTVAAPDGTILRAAAADVAVTAAGAPAIAPSAASVVKVTRSFEGLPYLWGGTSAFGFDCSGLTHLVYRLHGVVISRDADAQAKEGTPVARDALRPGDLLFYAKRNKPPHHVSMNVDTTRMVQSPQTGKTVEVVPMDSKPYAPDYIGARRYLN